MFIRLTAPVMTGILLLGALAGSAAATDAGLPMPQGEVILRVTGNIATSGVEGAAELDDQATRFKSVWQVKQLVIR